MKLSQQNAVSVCLWLVTCLSDNCSGQINDGINNRLLESIATITIAEDKSTSSRAEVFFETPDFVTKYGYPSESHVVQTDDGYILTVHRIPRGRASASNDTRVRAPVLLMHGLFTASEQWTYTGPDKGLAFILADAGYDVWMGNARGNYYSRKHATLSPKYEPFWNFSFHEMGNNDLPAVINHILDKTNQKQLFYVGHSMGCAMFFSLMTTQPEYNQKIRLAVELAPAVYLMKQRNLLGELVLRFTKQISETVFKAGIFEVLPREWRLAYLVQTLCGDGQILQSLCASFYYLFNGNSPNNQLNTTILPIYLTHFMAGTSLSTLDHLGKLYLSDDFVNYDKTRSNKAVAKYDLSQVSAPVVLYYSANDGQVAQDGVVRLSKELPNVVGKFKVPDKYKFNHMDFVIGMEVKRLVYDDMLRLMMKY